MHVFSVLVQLHHTLCVCLCDAWQTGLLLSVLLYDIVFVPSCLGLMMRYYYLSVSELGGTSSSHLSRLKHEYQFEEREPN
jgi:hypothetical protein